VANKTKPDSWQVAEDTNWKMFKFKDIISEYVDEENLALRKQLASFEERDNNRQKILDAIKLELDTVTAHNATLQMAMKNLNALLQTRDQELEKAKIALQRIYRKFDKMKEHTQGKEPLVVEADSVDIGTHHPVVPVNQ
jgi:uncharacterized membrane protein